MKIGIVGIGNIGIYHIREFLNNNYTVIASVSSKFKEIEEKYNISLNNYKNTENLIKNALDAIGTKKGLIEFKFSTDQKNIYIDISDNGKGIDLKDRKDVFRPGYSTKKRGWGLGLSLTKRIVEDYHKGKIFVKNSVLNEGTTFQIIFKKHLKS